MGTPIADSGRGGRDHRDAVRFARSEHIAVTPVAGRRQQMTSGQGVMRRPPSASPSYGT